LNNGGYTVIAGVTDKDDAANRQSGQLKSTQWTAVDKKHRVF